MEIVWRSGFYFVRIGRVKVEFGKIFPAEKVRRKDLIFSLFIDLLFKKRWWGGSFTKYFLDSNSKKNPQVNENIYLNENSFSISSAEGVPYATYCQLLFIEFIL